MSAPAALLTPEGRIDALVGLLTQLASGDLSARGVRSPAEDDVDAVVEGVNMLAEELEASRDELEERVRSRTAELQEANRGILRLTRLGNLLQACETVGEAYEIIGRELGSMFPGTRGDLYMFRSSRNLVEAKATWGGGHASEAIPPTGCWALRRGSVHVVSADEGALPCAHTDEQTGTSVCIVLSAHGETVGLLHLMRRPLRPGTDRDLSGQEHQLVLAVGEQVALALANLTLREKLQSQALRDPLTGLHNRRFVDEWIEREVRQSDRSGRPMGVMMVDVDHFKQVNDIHGHDAGDELLKAIAEVFAGALRPGDMPCRYGGEEFLVLLSDIDLQSLTARAEALRARVSDVRVRHHGTSLSSVTVSAGIALYPTHGRTADEVVAAADAALYIAKRDGRDRTQVALEPPTPVGAAAGGRPSRRH